MTELRTPLLPSTAEHAGQAQSDQLARAADQEEIHDAEPAGAEAVSPWLLTTVLMLGDMFGLGALTLPADFARLGWSLTLGALAACALGMCYSGVLFARLASVFPGSTAFDQFGKAAYGLAGQRLVYATIYACILITPVVFQITCAESLLTMLGQGRLSELAVHCIVLVIMLPLAQLRHLEEVGWLSVGGTLAMVAVVLIALGKILLMPAPGSSGTGSDTDSSLLLSMAAPEAGAGAESGGSSLRLQLVAIMDIVFAYGGCANWMRYITGMKHRRHFTRVASVGALFMTVCYVALGATGYAKLGDNFDLSKPVTSVLPYDGWTVVMNAALFLHCMVAYAINLNVWSDLLLQFVARFRGRGAGAGAQQQQQEGGPGAHSAAAWAATSAVGLLFCFVAARLFPYFTIVVALISSVGDLAAAYALPALFSLRLLKLPRWERWLCILLVPAAFGLSGVGMYCSLHELITKVLHH